MKICFIGGQNAGIIGLLTILSRKHNILSSISYSKELTRILKLFSIPVYKTIKNKKFIENLKKSDLLISVHGKEIVSSKLLKLPKYGGINVHPYLYKYKGADPVGRALEKEDFNGSVGLHIMTEEVDKGKVLYEEFVDISNSITVEEGYNKLYPYYSIVILKFLKKLEKK